MPGNANSGDNAAQESELEGRKIKPDVTYVSYKDDTGKLRVEEDGRIYMARKETFTYGDGSESFQTTFVGPKAIDFSRTKFVYEGDPD